MGSVNSVRLLLLVMLACLALVGMAAQTSSWSLSGTAAIFNTGVKAHATVVQLTSGAATYGAADFAPQGSLYFQDIYQLSTEWQAVSPYGGGSPRFSIAVDMDGDGTFDPSLGDAWIFAYLLPQYPSFSGGATAWLKSGNLIGNDNAGVWDTAQIAGGTNSDTYTHALSLLSGKAVLGVALVVDGGWFTQSYYGVDQTVWANNITVNSSVLKAAPPRGKK